MFWFAKNSNMAATMLFFHWFMQWWQRLHINNLCSYAGYGVSLFKFTSCYIEVFPVSKRVPFCRSLSTLPPNVRKTKANLISVEGNFLYTWKDQKTIVFRCFQGVKKDNVNKKWIKLYFLCGNICSEFIHMVVKEINNLTFL